MNYLKLVILLILSLGLVIVGLNLVTPPEAQAHPLPGFTPQPPPPPPTPPPGGGDDEDSGGGGDNGGHDNPPPSDYVIVQLERCNMKSCPISPVIISAGQKYEPLALVNQGDVSFPLFTPVKNAVPVVEIQAQVQLIHEGSGWITEGVISDAKNTRLALPYPGRWQVFLTQPPRFMTAEAIDTRSLNMAQLEAELKNGPISLGMVEADNPATQWVKCPLACVIDEPPATLPVTGRQSRSSGLLFVGGAFIWLLAVLLYRRKFCASSKD